MTRSPGSETIQARASNPPLTPFTIRKFSADSFSPLMEGEVQIVLMLTKIAERLIPEQVSPAESWWWLWEDLGFRSDQSSVANRTRAARGHLVSVFQTTILQWEWTWSESIFAWGVSHPHTGRWLQCQGSRNLRGLTCCSCHWGETKGALFQCCFFHLAHLHKHFIKNSGSPR